MGAPADLHVRDRALDTKRSFIVQAPAGSGKTELLTRRLLALLAVVGSPEEILAVTFTRKAAAEMRERVTAAIRSAAAGAFGEKDDGQKRELAMAAWRRSEEMSWRLEENPARLNISTIDGFNGYLAARMPWLTRLGGQPGVAADVDPLYGAAADRVIRHIDEGDEYSGALAAVLSHLDNRVGKLRDYLVALMGKRDQWLRKRPAIGDPEEFRPDLEAALGELVASRIARAARRLAPHLPEMAELARYGASNMDDGAETFTGESVPPVDGQSAGEWRRLASFFLTKKLEPRAKPDKSWGWPQGCDQERKERVRNLLESFRDDEDARKALSDLATLPDAIYADEEWRIIAPMVKVADLALACLYLEFRARGEVDFTETALRGLEALGRAGNPSELMLAIDRRLSHILVDEFQDTSHLQFSLLTALTQGWSEGDGRTLFAVGDPMQSIYRFREAEVGLFSRARDAGLGGLRLEPLGLAVNFRSSSALIERFNAIFPSIFTGEDNPEEGAVPYSPSAPHLEGDGEEPFEFVPLGSRDYEAEAAMVADEAQKWLGLDREGSVAILVRARGHLPAIIAELKRRGVAYRGEELDPLADRLAVKDVLSLARALADPADSLSWLAVLRAPWCGVSLADAHALMAGDGRPLCAIIPEALRDGRLSPGGRERISRLWAVLGPALGEVGRRPFRNLLEGVWSLLGAPAYLDPQEINDAMDAFALVGGRCRGGLPDLAEIDEAVGKLYSRPCVGGDVRLHVMTMHKAKGLEFDTVLLPGLGRQPKNEDRALISWAETTGGGVVVGVAPEVKAGATGRIADFIRSLEKVKEANERTRLIYVAATRAKKRLKMWGAASWNGKGEWRPGRGSLLQTLWPAVGSRFYALSPPEKIEEPDPDYSEKPVFLARLDPAWRPPEIGSPVLGRGEPAVSKDDEEVAYDWAREERKLVGTVAHAVFDRIGAEGLDAWSLERLGGERDGIKARLAELGVSGRRLEAAALAVAEAVGALLEDEKGRSLFDPSHEGVSEFSISVVEDGAVVTRRIDRTFVDAEGTRWVVDFKVTPHEGGDMAEFLAAQSERYRPQLSGYVEAFRTLEPGREVRAAIYYPLLKALVEVPSR